MSKRRNKKPTVNPLRAYKIVLEVVDDRTPAEMERFLDKEVTSMFQVCSHNTFDKGEVK